MNDRALKVLEQYDLEVNSMRRGRGAYILDTAQGLLSFSDYGSSEKKAQFQNCLAENMRQGGCSRVDELLPNREGNLVSRDWEGQSYVVRRWYIGRECDTASEADILTAVRNLAEIHRTMHVKGHPEFEASFTAPSPLEEMSAHNTELRKVQSFIRRKNKKGTFERLFQTSYPMWYEQAEEAQYQMEQMDCDRALGGSRSSGCVCHGDYDYHHVLILGNETATIGFEHCRYDLQVSDLYRFLRKILEKHNWNQRLGMRILDQYTSVRTLTGEERRILYLKMLYPEKFRKLANYYYSSRKSWISARFLEKLEAQNRQKQLRDEFLRLLK